MSYDRPNLRSYKHSAPFISIWYSLIIHVVIFVAALSLARTDFRLMADDFKKGVKSIVGGVFSEELSPDRSLINELFKAEYKINPDRKSIRLEKDES